jgi:enoyl-CoA hydratase/carnithine racemase
MSVEVAHRDGIALVKLAHGKANAIDEGVLAELSGALDMAESAGALVLASSSDRIFCAGWDLPAIFDFDRKRMGEFLDSFEDLVARLFSFGKPAVAALSGHAIAGGLILAACADERIAANGPAHFGLSEVVLGVPVPFGCLEVFRFVLGDRAAERLAATGENHDAATGRVLGLIDEIVSADRLDEAAFQRAQILAGRPAAAYAAIKRVSRQRAIGRIEAARSRRGEFLDQWFSKESRAAVSALVERLVGRSK